MSPVPAPHVGFGQVLSLLACLSLVQAQEDFEFSFDPDTLTRGDLVVWCIWTVLYLFLFVLCFIVLAIRKGHRIIYAILLPALFLTVIQCLSNIVYIVLSNNEFSFDGPPGGPGPVSAMSALFSFAGNTSVALFFLGIFMLFVDRYKAIHQISATPANLSGAMTAFGFVYSGFLFVMGLVDSGLNTVAQKAYWVYYNIAIVEVNSLQAFVDADLEDYLKKAKRAQDMNYAYAAFVDLTVFFMIGMGVFTMLTASRLRVSDTASKVAVFATLPCYCLFVLFSYFVFTIVFSPSGVKDLNASEQATIAADVMCNLFFYGTFLSVVVLGFIRSAWTATPPSQTAQYAYPMGTAYAQPGEYYKPTFPQPQVAPVEQHNEGMSSTTPPHQGHVSS